MSLGFVGVAKIEVEEVEMGFGDGIEGVEEIAQNKGAGYFALVLEYIVQILDWVVPARIDIVEAVSVSAEHSTKVALRIVVYLVVACFVELDLVSALVFVCALLAFVVGTAFRPYPLFLVLVVVVVLVEVCYIVQS